MKLFNLRRRKSNEKKTVQRTQDFGHIEWCYGQARISTSQIHTVNNSLEFPTVYRQWKRNRMHSIPFSMAIHSFSSFFLCKCNFFFFVYFPFFIWKWFSFLMIFWTFLSVIELRTRSINANEFQCSKIICERIYYLSFFLWFFYVDKLSENNKRDYRPFQSSNEAHKRD